MQLELVLLNEKQCARCRITKSTHEFGVDRKRRDGLNCWCRNCKRQDSKRQAALNKARFSLLPAQPADVPKRCNKCDVTKSVTEFGVDRTRRDGLNAYCKECICTRSNEVYRRDPKAAYARTHAWAVNNRKRLCDRQKGYYRKRREQYLSRQQAYRDANREFVREQGRRYRQLDGGAHRARQARRRAQKTEAATVTFSVDQLTERWIYYGNKCWICRSPATATDHVKPLSKGGAHMLCNLRPICTRCNCSKGAKWPLSEVDSIGA